MSHKDEAVKGLRAVENMDVSENVRVLSGEEKADQIAIQQLKATLALVEAQEAANEQARIANLIALWRGSAVKNEYASEGEHGLFDTRGKLRPRIAAALRIGGDA